MDRIWLLFFLLSSIAFVYFVAVSNKTRMSQVQERIRAKQQQYKSDDVPFEEDPSVVFKPLFTEDSLLT